ncbi:hypothetical protein BVRB_2g042620 [Beta vulgaris subsp. vulgaris]|nr:hypothetical protein BVRB_2g042620 [Beta vulgaris subsp. vulgaris]
MIAALLIDAEQRQSENNAVKLWLEDLQDAAYDLEDILDEFATRAQLHLLEEESEEDDDIEDVNKISVNKIFESTKHRSMKVVLTNSWQLEDYLYLWKSSYLEDYTDN